MHFGKLKMAVVTAAVVGTVAAQAATLKELPGFGVQSQEQLDAWRARTCRPGDSSQGADPAPRTLFYTGKPYDADQGSYVFKFRAYDPSAARWTSADPSGFPDGANQWVYVKNHAGFIIDSNGLWGHSIHAQIYQLWLGDTFSTYTWRGYSINVYQQMLQKSDQIDAVHNQFSDRAYEHAMRTSGQAVENAAELYNRFIDSSINIAKNVNDTGRNDNNYAFIEAAVSMLGGAGHPLADNYAPSHAGFQEWNLLDIGALAAHKLGETQDMYDAVSSTINRSFYT